MELHGCALLIQLFFLLFTVNISTVTSALRSKTKLILLVLDGLQWDRFGLDLPNLNEVERKGVRADWMNNVFVSLTLPNLYTIATGLYPETHGVVHNFAWSVERKTQYTNLYEDTLNITEWFDTGVEPIWVTAKLSGLKVGNIMYPGAQRPVKGILPDIVVPNAPFLWYNYTMTQRIDDTVSWLKYHDYDMVLTWFNEPDLTLHTYGVGHPESVAKTYEADDAVGYLFHQLNQHGIQDQTNVIIVSDHGHINYESRKLIALYDHIDEADVDFMIFYGPMFQMIPVDGKEKEIYDTLKNAHPALEVFRKEDFPAHLHYAKNDRVLPIIGVVDAGWILTLNYEPEILAAASGSDHGFLNSKWMSMKSSFYAQGPFFRKGYRSRPIESVDVYNLMCEILDLEPAPNNGSRDRYVSMIATNDVQNYMDPPVLLSTLFLCLIVVLWYVWRRTAHTKQHRL